MSVELPSPARVLDTPAREQNLVIRQSVQRCSQRFSITFAPCSWRASQARSSHALRFSDSINHGRRYGSLWTSWSCAPGCWSFAHTWNVVAAILSARTLARPGDHGMRHLCGQGTRCSGYHGHSWHPWRNRIAERSVAPPGHRADLSRRATHRARRTACAAKRRCFPSSGGITMAWSPREMSQCKLSVRKQLCFSKHLVCSCRTSI
jgi:hypothetical protein